MHEHSTKLPVSRSNSQTFMFSPKCVPNDPFGIAGTVWQVVCETDSDTNTFLYGDCSDPGCNSCLQVTNCLGVAFTHWVLQITPQVKFRGGWGGKSGERSAHSMLLLMSQSLNCCPCHNTLLLEVWAVAPSCWNHCNLSDGLASAQCKGYTPSPPFFFGGGGGFT